MRTAVTRTAYYLLTLLPVHTLYLHVHHAFFFINIATSKWVFYSTITQGVDGWAIFLILFEFTPGYDSPEIVYALADFLQQLLRSIQRLILVDLSSYLCLLWLFLWYLKGSILDKKIPKKSWCRKALVLHFLWNIFSVTMFFFN